MRCGCIGERSDGDRWDSDTGLGQMDHSCRLKASVDLTNVRVTKCAQCSSSGLLAQLRSMASNSEKIRKHIYPLQTYVPI